MTTEFPRAAAAPADWHLGTLMIWHLTSDQTGGAIAVGEVIVRPGCEPPLHSHANEDETWYVIDGDVVFQRGDERLLLRGGESIFLPRNAPHGFAVRSDEARMIHAYTPGGIEDAFRSASTPAADRVLPPLPDGPPDPEQAAAIEATYAAHGVTFVGPPLPVVLEAEQFATERR